MFNQVTVSRPKDPPKVVFCESDAHSPRGSKPAPHRLHSECKHPRRASLVICDRHSIGCVGHVPHRESFACEGTAIHVGMAAAAFEVES